MSTTAQENQSEQSEEQVVQISEQEFFEKFFPVGWTFSREKSNLFSMRKSFCISEDYRKSGHCICNLCRVVDADPIAVILKARG